MRDLRLKTCLLCLLGLTALPLAGQSSKGHGAPAAQSANDQGWSDGTLDSDELNQELDAASLALSTPFHAIADAHGTFHFAISRRRTPATHLD